METFAGGLTSGLNIGIGLRDEYNRGALQGSTGAIQNMALQEGVGPDGQPIYRYGNNVYTQKPEDAQLAAHRQQMMGQAQGQYGAPDKAAAYDDAAVKTRKGFVEDLVKRAFSVGTPEALQSAYSLINTGERTELRYGEDGTVELWSHPYDAPDKAQMAFSSPSPAEFVAHMSSQYSPDVVNDWTRRSLEQDKILSDMGLNDIRARNEEQGIIKSQQDVRNSQVANYIKELGLQGIPTSAPEFLAIMTAERKAANESVELAVKSGDQAAVANALRNRDEIEGRIQAIQQAAQSWTLPDGGGSEVKGGDGAPPAGLILNESGGRWDASNNAKGSGGKRGHYGRLQFGHDRLAEAQKALGAKFSPQEFMANPELQKQVEAWHFSDIRKYIRDKGLDQYIGKSHKGVRNLTMDALVSVAHLSGKQGLSSWLSDPEYNKSDGANTQSDYARKHNTGDSSQGGLSHGGTTSPQQVDPYQVQAQGLLRQSTKDNGIKMGTTNYADVVAEVTSNLEDNPNYYRATPAHKQQMFDAELQRVIAFRQRVNNSLTNSHGSGGVTDPEVDREAMLQRLSGLEESLFGASE